MYINPTPEDFNNVKFPNKGILIAHAGGAIGGKTYTNSIEAINASVAAGFSFIELDLILTCDGQVVAAHDWEHFRSISGTGKSEECLSLEEFKAKKVHNQYNVVTATDINFLFSKNEELFLVTDKIRDFSALLSQINVSKDRLLVEVFSYKDYVKALKRGIKYPMLCIWNERSFNKHFRHLTSGMVSMITIPEKLIPKLGEQLKLVHDKGVSIFAFSSNDEGYVKRYLGEYVTGFYTDSIVPQK